MIKITRKKTPFFKNSELKWNRKDEINIKKRILNLKADQITSLPFLVKIIFDKDNLKSTVNEILKNKIHSVNLETIICEADSKENLIWWVNYFENFNKKGISIL